MITESPGYLVIKEFYGDKRAARSQVLLMDHIDQGIEILHRYGSDKVVMEAYAVHPIFQNDEDLAANYTRCDDLHPLVTLYALEYRNIANKFLSNKIIREPSSARVWDDRNKIFIKPAGQYTLKAKHPIKLSPVFAVNEMLVADKVQNRKDFLRYHAATHERSEELDFYFKLWMEALEISEERFQELTEGM